MILNDDVGILEVKVRLIQEADLPALEWDGEYSHFRYLYREIFENMMRNEAVLWVADYKEIGIVGQLFVQLVSKRKDLADGLSRAYIFGFRIKPRFRGIGIGTKLLNVAEEDLINRGYRRIFLNVNQDNQMALRFYRQNGFTIVSAESGRWSYVDHAGQRREVNEPAWRMMKWISR